MKDLEKIKSEDLGCQVADANPANFAIEQEVAQLVGATVPAPTEPSADDARELGAQLLVFLRRALLPIRSALRTAVAAIYAHLDSRCTDYTPAAYDPFRLPSGPYDPMRPLTPRTLPNLLTALTAFSDRKISGADVADGMSIVQMLCKGYSTNLTDDNTWTLDRTDAIGNMLKCLTAVETLQLGCSLSTTDKALGNAPQSLKKLVFSNLKKIEYTNTSSIWFIYNSNNIEEIEFPELVQAQNVLRWNGSGWWLDCFAALTKLSLPKLEIVDANYAGLIGGGCPSLTKLELPMLHTLNGNLFGGQVLRNLTELRMPSLTRCNATIQSGTYPGTNAYDDLLLLEVGAVETNLNLAWWTAANVLQNNLQQFLLNFKNYIALRLTANGTGLTLTLSQAVRNAIHAAESTYGIENIIVTQKGWTISPAPN